MGLLSRILGRGGRAADDAAEAVADAAEKSGGGLFSLRTILLGGAGLFGFNAIKAQQDVEEQDAVKERDALYTTFESNLRSFDKAIENHEAYIAKWGAEASTWTQIWKAIVNFFTNDSIDKEIIRREQAIDNATLRRQELIDKYQNGVDSRREDNVMKDTFDKNLDALGHIVPDNVQQAAKEVYEAPSDIVEAVTGYEMNDTLAVAGAAGAGYVGYRLWNGRNKPTNGGDGGGRDGTKPDGPDGDKDSIKARSDGSTKGGTTKGKGAVPGADDIIDAEWEDVTDGKPKADAPEGHKPKGRRPRGRRMFGLVAAAAAGGYMAYDAVKPATAAEASPDATPENATVTPISANPVTAAVQQVRAGSIQVQKTSWLGRQWEGVKSAVVAVDDTLRAVDAHVDKMQAELENPDNWTADAIAENLENNAKAAVIGVARGASWLDAAFKANTRGIFTGESTSEIYAESTKHLEAAVARDVAAGNLNMSTPWAQAAEFAGEIAPTAAIGAGAGAVARAARLGKGATEATQTVVTMAPDFVPG